MMLAYHVVKHRDWYCHNGNLFAYAVLQVCDWIFALFASSVFTFAVYAIGEPIFYAAYIVKALG